MDDIGPEACPTPLVSEAGGRRVFPDPLVHGTRARLGRHADAGLEGLSAIVFSGAWSSDDRSADGVRLDGPTMAALGIDLEVGETDDADRARAAAASLERALQTWQAAHADAPGAADVAELSLVCLLYTSPSPRD